MKNIKIITLALVILALLSTTVFAHAMLLEEIEPGVLQASYDGGGISPRTVITLYDASGAELASEGIDDDGIAKFDPSIDWKTAEASDGMGHAITIERGVEQKELPKVPIVIGVLVVVGAIVWYTSKGKKEEEN